MCCHFFLTFCERENCNLKKQGIWPQTRGHKSGHQLAQTWSRSLLATSISYFFIAELKQLTNTSQRRNGSLWLMVPGATGCPAEEDMALGRKESGLTLQLCIFNNILISLSLQTIVKGRDLVIQCLRPSLAVKIYDFNSFYSPGISYMYKLDLVIPPPNYCLILSFPMKPFFFMSFLFLWVLGFHLVIFDPLSLIKIAKSENTWESPKEMYNF